MNKVIIENLTELENFASQLLTDLMKKTTVKQATIMALSGDLGAGKTTFVQLLAKQLGVKEMVTSPTFTIMKLYDIPDNSNFRKLIHMDAYRIEDISELAPLQFAGLMDDKNNLLCIEWAEKIQVVLPASVIKLDIQILENEKREITYTI